MKPKSHRGKLRMEKNNTGHRLVTEKIQGSEGCVIFISYPEKHPPRIKEYRGK